MSKNFLIAFDGAVGSERYNSFTKAFSHAFSAEVQEDLTVDAIDYVVSKDQAENALKNGYYDVLVCFEKMQNTSIGQGTVKVWMKEYPGLKIILVVENTRKSTGKMKGLFDRGYYDASYFKDFSPSELIQAILHPRSKEEAWDYYGLDEYVDILAKNKMRPAKESAGAYQATSATTMLAQQESASQDIEDKKKDLSVQDPLNHADEESKLISQSDGLIEMAEENGAEYAYSDAQNQEAYEYEDGEMLQDTYSDDENEHEITEQYAEMVLSYFTKEDIVKLRNLEMNLMNEQEFSAAIWEKIEEYGLTEQESEIVYRKSISHFFGYDVIESLLDDNAVSDIRIMSPETIRIKRRGLRETVPVHFRSADHYKSFVAHLASKNNVRIDDTHAVRTFTDTHHDKFFLRVNITTEYISGTGLPYVHIRKTSRIKYTMEELIEAGMFDVDMKSYLLEKVNSDGGIIICGKGGSGKSTLTNTLIEYIPHSNSGLVIQENFELFSSTHPEMMEQNLMTDEELNSDGEALSYDLKTLAINGLLLDLDYYIIGEIKGGEALYFLNAWYTGHRCMTTLHSDTALHAMDKLVDYAMYESRYSKEELLRMVADRATIIYMKGFKIYEVVEAAGWDEGIRNIRYRKIFFRDRGGWIRES